MLQLANEIVKLIDATIAGMGMNNNFLLDDQDPILSISKYIETMHISVWEIALFLEFFLEKRIHKNKKAEN